MGQSLPAQGGQPSSGEPRFSPLVSNEGCSSSSRKAQRGHCETSFFPQSTLAWKHILGAFLFTSASHFTSLSHQPLLVFWLWHPGSTVRQAASPGLAMLLRTAMGFFPLPFCSSSCILSRSGRVQGPGSPCERNFRFVLCTFSKHLLRDRLWRTEFFQPSGAVCRSRARHKFRPGVPEKPWPSGHTTATHSGAC